MATCRNASSACSDAPEPVRQRFVDRRPMGRFRTAYEIAHIAVFLASDESSYATGQAFIIDGGTIV